ncbi:MAG: hypothetical protein R6V28_11000 [Nitriliruptoraceae bacterium]
MAAAVVIVVVVVLVLLFGVARPPQLATVEEVPTPSPEASVAWSQWEEGGSCIHTVDPQGTRSEVGCGYEGELLAWTDDGIVVLAWGPREAAEVAEVIDPDTGEVVDRVDDLDGEPEEWRREPHGGVVHSRNVDGTLTVTLRDGDVELWRVDAPGRYGIEEAVLSPDGVWVAMVDRSERLLLVPADGSAAPRVWAEVDERWVRPVWEGSTLTAPEDG